MANATPENRTQLKAQYQIPDHVRQSLLVIEFLEPILIWHSQDFYRIHLSHEQFQAGEDRFFMPDIWQPHREARSSCILCRGETYRLNPYQARCLNRSCERYGRIVETAPLRGVVQVVVTEDMIHHTETKDGIPTEFISACCLVLDRRYSERTLVEVRHSAGRIAETMGWKIK